MKLTVKEVHTYNNLVNQGLEPPLEIPGSDVGEILVPNVDENDQVYFKNLIDNSRIYPGRNTTEKIKKAIDKFLNQ